MRLPCTALLVLLPAICAAAQPSTMFMADAAKGGMYSSQPVARLAQVRFAFQADGPIRSAPAVAGGSVYFGSTGGTFYALDAGSGKERWRFHTGGAITSSAAVREGRVYFSSRDGTLYALNAASGKVAWKHAFRPDLGPGHYWDFYQSSPTLDGTALYIGTGDGHVLALRAADGKQLWDTDVQSRVRTTPAIAQGKLVLGTMSGLAVALDQKTGAKLWSYATQGASHKFEDKDNDTTSIVASPSIGGDTVLVGGRDGFMYGIGLADGRERWRATHDGASWLLSSAWDGKSFFVGGGSASLVQSVAPADGKEVWRFKTGGAVFGAVTLAGNSVLATDFGGTLFAIDRSTGAQQWRFPLGGRSAATPVAVDGVVYSGSDSGVLFALSASGDAALAPGRRIVYREGMKSDKAFAWFKNGVDLALFEGLKGMGYEALGAQELAQMMRAAPHSVVVFSDNKVPELLLAEEGGVPLIRRYLDAGGKVVFPGPNPLAFHADPASGQVEKIDYTPASKTFGMRFPEQKNVNGYYASLPAPAGRAAGLHTPMITYFALDKDASAGVSVLATDEHGNASAWLKNFGGAPGTGLLQLPLSRQSLAELSEFAAAAEQGVTW